mgnify:CR=1 FL=1
MIKNNLKTMIITSIIILLPILAGLILWDKLPEEIPTHFNSQGVADSFSSKPFAVFALPLFLLAVHWICLAVSSLDPKSKNINGKALTLVLWICPVLSLLMGSIIYAFALEFEFNINFIMNIFFGLLFIVIGNYMPKCKQSYTMGIKIPWTLDSEENWNYTHRLAGKLWVIGGFLIIFTGFLKQYWIFAAITAIMVIVPIICSYRFYVKHDKNKQNN